jgi:hypothetical protein
MSNYFLAFLPMPIKCAAPTKLKFVISDLFHIFAFSAYGVYEYNELNLVLCLRHGKTRQGSNFGVKWAQQFLLVHIFN